MTRRQALLSLGLIMGLDETARAQRLGRPAPALLTIDLGQFEAIVVRHPVMGREPYVIDPADIARALRDE
jgi:hypothetical protein